MYQPSETSQHTRSTRRLAAIRRKTSLRSRALAGIKMIGAVAIAVRTATKTSSPEAPVVVVACIAFICSTDGADSWDGNSS